MRFNYGIPKVCRKLNKERIIKKENKTLLVPLPNVSQLLENSLAYTNSRYHSKKKIFRVGILLIQVIDFRNVKQNVEQSYRCDKKAVTTNSTK